MGSAARFLPLRLLGLLCFALGGVFSAVGQANYDLDIVSFRGGGDTVFVELYISSRGSVPADFFELGNANFVVDVNTLPTAGQVDIATAAIRPVSADSGAFNGPAVLPPANYAPIIVSGDPGQGFVNVTVSQDFFPPAGPGVEVNATPKLICRYFMLMTNNTACSDTLELSWRVFLGTITAYSTNPPIPGTSLKPLVFFNNAAPLPLGNSITLGPGLSTTVCGLTNNFQLFTAYPPASWDFTASAPYVTAFTSANPSLDTVAFDIGANFTGAPQPATLTAQGFCPASVTLNVQPNPLINGPTEICVLDTAQFFEAGGNLVDWSTASLGVLLPLGPTNGTTNVDYFVGPTITGFTDLITAVGTNGCADTALLRINPLPPTSIQGPVSVPVASPGEVFNVALPVEPTSIYTWDTSGNVVDTALGGVLNDTLIVDFGGTGLGQITLQQVDTNGCVGEDTLLVAIQGCPNEMIIGPDSICGGETVAFTHTTDSTFNLIWSADVAVGPGTGIAALTPSGTNNNTVTLDFENVPVTTTRELIVDYAGCGDTLDLTILPPPTITTPLNDTTVCVDSRITFESDFNSNWEVLRGNATSIGTLTDSIAFTFSQPGVDTIIAGFRTCSDSIVVTVASLPVVAITGEAFIPEPVQTSSLFPFTYAATLGFVNYTWSSPLGGPIAAIVSPNAQATQVDFDPTLGTDTLVVLVEDANQCIGTDTLVIEKLNCTADANVLASVGADTTVCVGEIAWTFVQNPGGTLFQWQSAPFPAGPWNNATGPFPNSQVYLTTPQPAPNALYYRVIVTDTLCSDTSATSVEVITVAPTDTGQVVASADTVCINDPTVTIQLASGATAFPAVFDWEESLDGFFWAPMGITAAVLNVPTSTPGTRFYRAVFANGCDTTTSNVVTIVVSDSADGDFPVPPVFICSDTTTAPLGAILTTGAQGTWSSTGSGGFTNASDPLASYVATAADGGTTIDLTWTVTSPGCPPDINTQPLDISPLPTGSFDIPPAPVCFGDTTAPLGATAGFGTTGTWQTPNGSGTFVDAFGVFAPNDPNARYASVDADSGQAIILQWVLTSDPCASVTLEQLLDVGRQPQGDFPGPLNSVCNGQLSDTLNAVGVVGTGTWTANGFGSMNVINSTTAQYNSVAADAGTVVTISYIISSGGCTQRVINQPIAVDAFSQGSFGTLGSLPTDTICSGGNTQPLGAVATSGTGVFTAAYAPPGPPVAGAFTPTATNLNARYQSGLADGGQDIQITWTVTNGNCPSVFFRDTFFVTSDIVDGTFPGPLPDLCVGESTTPLGATAVAPGVGFFSVSPLTAGSFSNPVDGNTTFNATSNLGPTQIPVTLRWTITNANCNDLELEQSFVLFDEPDGILSPPTSLDVCQNDTSGQFVANDLVADTAYWHTPNGNGSFTDSLLTFTQYVPGPGDEGQNILIQRILKNGPCDSLILQQVLRVGRLPVGGFPGPVANTCAGSATNPLNAFVVAGTGTWSTNGVGSFSAPNNPAAVYNSDPADASSIVDLTWTITSPGCPAISFTNTVTVLAVEIQATFPGPIAPLCGNDTTPLLAATVTQGIRQPWRAFIEDSDVLLPGLDAVANGVGFFENPNATQTRFVVTDSSLADTIVLSFEVQAPGCNSRTFEQLLAIDKPGDVQIIGPVADTVCTTASSILFEAQLNQGVGRWVNTGAGGPSSLQNPDTSLLNGLDPSPLDVGTNVLLLYIADGGACPDDIDTVTVRSNQTPAGSFVLPPDAICAGAQTGQLPATVSVGTGTWASTGAGFFIPDSTTPNAQYVSDTSEAGTFPTLQWIVRNGVCPPVTYTQPLEVLDIQVEGTFDTITSPIICCTGLSDPLNATVTVGFGSWTTDGFGTFLPNADDPNAVYQPLGGDCGDTVNLTWNIDDSTFTCVTRTITNPIVVNNPPTGAILTNPTPICVVDTTDTLFATVLDADSGFWSCTGCTGNFIFPDSTDSTTIRYASSLDDTLPPSIQLVWNVTKLGCPNTPIPANLTVFDSSRGTFPPLIQPVICAGEFTDTLGATEVFGNGIWDCINCQGGFQNFNTGDSARYLAGLADGNQTVGLLWIVQNGVCPPVTLQRDLVVDTLPVGDFITILPKVCVNDTTIPLGATLSSGSGFWSVRGGQGFFLDPLDPNTRYVADTADADTTVFLQWNIFNGTCDTTTFEQFIDVVPPPSVSFSDTSVIGVCTGTTSETLSPLTQSNEGGALSFNWTTTGAGTFLPTPPNTREVSYSVSPLDAGDTVVLTITVQSAVCPDTSVSAQQRIQVLGGINIVSIDSVFNQDGTLYNLPEDTICQLDTIVAYASVDPSGSTLGQVFSWTGTQLAPPTTTPNVNATALDRDSAITRIAPNRDGRFRYRVTATDTVTGCISTDEFFVNTDPGIPAIEIVEVGTNDTLTNQTDSLCQGDSIRVQVLNGSVPYIWTTNTGQNLDDSASSARTLSPLASVQLTVRSLANNGCLSEATLRLPVIPTPQAVITGGDICADDTLAAFTVDPAIGCEEVLWFSDDLPQILNPANGPFDENNGFYETTAFTFQPFLAGSLPLDPNFSPFSLTAKCANPSLPLQCFSADDITFEVVRLPTAQNFYGREVTIDTAFVPFDYPYDSIPGNDLTILIPFQNATDTNLSRLVVFAVPPTDTADIANYAWFFDDYIRNDPFFTQEDSINNTSDSPTPYHRFTRPGTYTIVLYVENRLGCFDIAVKSNLIEILEETFYFPTAFTPNGVGPTENELFGPLPASAGAVMKDFLVKDRWGTTVYQANNILNWDGNTESGTPFEPGTYLWRAVIELDTSGDVEFSGYVTLLR